MLIIKQAWCFLLITNLCLASGHLQQDMVTIIRRADRTVNAGFYVAYANDPEHCLCAKHAERLFTPGSLMKVITAAAAFSMLGPDFRYTTDILAHGSVHKGMLRGNIYIKASGDPSFMQDDLKHLLIVLRKRGIRHIQGTLFIDGTMFEENPTSCYGPGFCIDDLGKSDMSPITGFILDHNDIDNGCHQTVTPQLVYEGFFKTIAQLCRSAGIIVRGPVRIGRTPACAKVLVRHRSAPLATLMQQMLQESDNLYANALFKYLGSLMPGSVGTWQSGSQALVKFLSKTIGIDTSGIKIIDGAGLSRYNLLTPKVIAHVLAWVYKNCALYSPYARSLAQPGKPGTLADRLTGISQKIYAKTGTMSGVSGLAGYLIPTAEPAMPIIFTIMLNGFIQKSTAPGNLQSTCMIDYKHDIEDAFCKRLCEQL